MDFPNQYRTELYETLASVDVSLVEKVIEVFREARDKGRHIFVCGNGGSASSASHFVCDTVKAASYGRTKRFKVVALADQVPTITAYSNDVAYDSIFVEQLMNFAEPGDVVMALSGSGNSPNVVRAIEYGKQIGCTTIGLSGRDGGKLAKLSDISIHVPFQHMGRIEDAHMMVCHMICYYFMENPEA